MNNVFIRRYLFQVKSVKIIVIHRGIERHYQRFARQSILDGPCASLLWECSLKICKYVTSFHVLRISQEDWGFFCSFQCFQWPLKTLCRSFFPSTRIKKCFQVMLIERQPTVFILMSFHFSHSFLSIFREIFYVDKQEVL